MLAAMAAMASITACLAACGQAPAEREAQRIRPLLRPVVRPVPAEKAGVGRVVVDWQRRGAVPDRVVIGAGGVALAPPESPLVRYLFARRERAEDVRFLRATFGPFELEGTAGRLVFHGGGPVAASPAERRMVLEWARQVAAEAAGGRDAAAYGLALAWDRGGGAGGLCDALAVYRSGEARASSCSWAGEEVRGHLDRKALVRLYGWLDRWVPFQAAGGTAPSGEAVPERLVFAGAGPAPAPPDEQAALAAFAAALHRELAARRSGRPAGTEPLPGSGAAAAAPPVPAGRLLRPDRLPEPRDPPVAAPAEPPPPPQNQPLRLK